MQDCIVEFDLEELVKAVRKLKFVKRDYEKTVKDCEELIKKAEQELKEVDGKI